VRVTVEITFICPACGSESAHSDDLVTWYCNHCGAGSPDPASLPLTKKG
jgi:ribosomal protein L37AE/L43A